MKEMGLFLCSMFVAFGANATAIYGTLTVDGRLPGRPMEIQLICAGMTTAAPIDASGWYLFTNLPTASACQVRVEGAAASVVLYSNPTRYDFALTHEGGATILRQR